MEGRSGDGWYGSASSGSGSGGGGGNRFGAAASRSDRCGGSSIIGWGADNAPFADSGRW